MTKHEHAVQMLNWAIRVLAQDMCGEVDDWGRFPDSTSEAVRKRLDLAILRAAYAVASGKEPQP